MSEFNKILRNLRLEEGLTQKELGEKIKLSNSTISMYERGEREPELEVLEIIADFFNVSIDFLHTGKEIKSITSSIPDGFIAPPQTVKRPRLGVISCGTPINSEENFDGFDDVPTQINCDFTLVCEGDSMTGARINDGDLVYIRQQSTIESGEIAAILVDGVEKLLKRVYLSESSIILQAENPLYPPLVFSKEDMNRISIIGKAVGFTSIIK